MGNRKRREISPGRGFDVLGQVLPQVDAGAGPSPPLFVLASAGWRLAAVANALAVPSSSVWVIAVTDGTSRNCRRSCDV